MRARRNDDSDIGDLIDPAVGGAQPPHAAGPVSRPNPQSHGQVYIGRGEREERAYMPPTSLPSIAKPKEATDKVAISSSVDPRRMQTMRLSPGRPRAPLTPDERPDGIIEDPASSGQFAPPSVRPSQRGPKSSMAHATVMMKAPPPTATAGPPMIVWILAVALAALIGAGTALWLRRGNATPTPAAPVTAPAPR